MQTKVVTQAHEHQTPNMITIVVKPSRPIMTMMVANFHEVRHQIVMVVHQCFQRVRCTNFYVGLILRQSLGR